jgi:hypothetical protein
MAVAEQLYTCDRDAFLRAVANRFAGRSEIGEGEFACASTSAFDAVDGSSTRHVSAMDVGAV